MRVLVLYSYDHAFPKLVFEGHCCQFRAQFNVTRSAFENVNELSSQGMFDVGVLFIGCATRLLTHNLFSIGSGETWRQDFVACATMGFWQHIVC